MQRSVRKFIKEVRREKWWFFKRKKVIEIGSRNVNGTPRRYFWFCNYHGVDLSEGPGVDYVFFIHDSPVPQGKHKYDVVISTDTLEHDRHWVYTLDAMYAWLKPGGLMIITCAGPHMAEHGTTRTLPNCSPETTDYYRNLSTDDFENILPPDWFTEYCLQYSQGKMNLQFYGIKK